jgi:hypothetical protein
MTSSALGSIPLSAHSNSERTVTNDNYHLSPEKGWRVGEPKNEVHGIIHIVDPEDELCSFELDK